MKEILTLEVLETAQINTRLSRVNKFICQINKTFNQQQQLFVKSKISLVLIGLVYKWRSTEST